MELPTLKVERLYRQISGLIIQLIREGRFKVGAALPAERDLAKQLGVGRSSVREALIALEIAGWVEIRTGTGVFVLTDTEKCSNALPEPTSASDLLEARGLFEGELAALAATRGSQAQQDELAQVLAGMAAEHVENAAFHVLDTRFHLLLAEMAGNELLRMMAQQLWNERYTPLFQQLENRYGVAEWVGQTVEQHRAIYTAIAARDAAAARQAMKEHVACVAERLFRHA